MATKRRKKKKNGKAPAIFIVIVAALIVAAAILFFNGVFDFERIENAVNNKTAIAYIDYSDSTDSKMTINSEGRVLDTLLEEPEDIPKLTGLEFTKIVQGDLLEYADENGFDYAMNLASALKKYGIYVSEINIDEENNASAYVGDIVILFGVNEKTEQKVADLSDFFDQVKDLKGTLHMEEVNDRVGYTFKKEKEAAAEKPVSTVEAETTTEAEPESEEFTEEEYYEEEPLEDWQNYEEPVYDEWQEQPVEEYYYEEENDWVYEEQQW